MSESNVDIKVGTDSYDKLKQYLMLRLFLCGVWVDKKPDYWLNAILSSSKKFETRYCTDSGGGPLPGFRMSVIDYKGKVEFRIHIRPNESGCNETFQAGLRSVYSYMRSYTTLKDDSLSDLDRWEDRIGEDSLYLPEEIERRTVRAWFNTFGLDNTVKADSHPMCSDLIDDIGIFDLLRTYQCIYGWEQYFNKKGMSQIIKAKQWALFAMAEAQRYYRTDC